MVQNDIRKLVIIVLPANAQEISHTYDLPNATSKAFKAINGLLNEIQEAMLEKKGKYLFALENPTIIYNAKHIIGVRVEGLSKKELQSIQSKMGKRIMGFQSSK
jgi:hypothetical protein